MSQKNNVQAAWLRTWPVMFAYLFMSIAFGLSLNQAGFGVGWALLLSVVVYAGSLQFAMVSFLAAGTAIGTTALLSLLLNARHMFYGISFITRFKQSKKLFPYMVFSLTDETYSVLAGAEWPEGIDSARADFYVSLMNQLSWVIGSVIGSLAGRLIPFDFAGVEFSMTALFVIIFMNQWQATKDHFPAIAGLVSASVFLLILGPDRFILPSLIVTVLIVLVFKAIPMTLHTKREKEAEHADTF